MIIVYIILGIWLFGLSVYVLGFLIDVVRENSKPMPPMPAIPKAVERTALIIAVGFIGLIIYLATRG